MYKRQVYTITLKSGTAGVHAHLVYSGLASNCFICGATFTDIYASGSAQEVTDWVGAILTRCGNAIFTVNAANATAGDTYTNNGQTFTVDATIAGGTTLTTTMQSSLRSVATGNLVRVTGSGTDPIVFSSVSYPISIINRTPSDLATTTQAAKILDDTTISGITGTIATKTLSAANETVAAGYYAATTLSAVDVDLAAANIVTGKTIFGFAGSASGGSGGPTVGPFEVGPFR